ncbi:MAG: winged helix-turn-helix transcriptional regulator [Nitrososphaerota archaeon]|nr:winged helix-turn-helix transcriptional regulator [Nitrososphaerota archaeon]MDG6965601.1 winged helix-turn-helix transcriptional regulator [Nitrososphaerota archaeon]MDG6987484.1 winged helix-turn-helix transcriptional regulator [Nitrososphaerota archaeon]
MPPIRAPEDKRSRNAHTATSALPPKARRENQQSQAKMKLVEIIKDSEVAKLISDPMRRGILNLLRRRAMSQSELAESLGLTDGTVNYHLGLLRGAGFLKVARAEIEEHGIMQKFYVPTAYLYLPDAESLPLEAARYYYPVNIERMRGVLSAGSQMHGRLANLDVDALAEDLAKEVVKVAGEYVGMEVSQGKGEEQVNEIYSRALSRLIRRAER